MVTTTWFIICSWYIWHFFTYYTEPLSQAGCLSLCLLNWNRELPGANYHNSPNQVFGRTYRLRSYSGLKRVQTEWSCPPAVLDIFIRWRLFQTRHSNPLSPTKQKQNRHLKRQRYAAQFTTVTVTYSDLILNLTNNRSSSTVLFLNCILCTIQTKLKLMESTNNLNSRWWLLALHTF